MQDEEIVELEVEKRTTNEYKLHVACVKHVKACFIGNCNPWLKFWHTPNQTRDSTEAFFNKQMGAEPGVPDLMFSWPLALPPLRLQGVHMGVIELKSGRNKLTSSQNKWLSSAWVSGWHTGEAKTVRELHDIIVSWGLKPSYDTVSEPDYLTFEQKNQRYFDMLKPL